MIGLGKSKTDHANHGNRKDNELLHDFLHRPVVRWSSRGGVREGSTENSRVSSQKRRGPAQDFVFTRPFKARTPAMSGGIPAGRMRSKEASLRLILSTFSMPSITAPQTVYCPLRKGASSKQMKNWLSAESGFCARAIEVVLR